MCRIVYFSICSIGSGQCDIASRIGRAGRCVVTVGKRVQERDDVVDLAIVEPRRLARTAVVGWFLRVDVATQRFGQVIELVRYAGGIERIPALWMGVAFDV